MALQELAGACVPAWIVAVVVLAVVGLEATSERLNGHVDAGSTSDDNEG